MVVKVKVGATIYGDGRMEHFFYDDDFLMMTYLGDWKIL